MKDLAYYMALPYTFTLIAHPDVPGCAIKVNEMPGCISQGDTADEALVRIREAMEAWTESAIEDGQEVPEPGDERGGNLHRLARAALPGGLVALRPAPSR